MKHAKFEDISYSNYLERIKVFYKKSHDYADKDALSNFKRIATLCSLFQPDITKPDGVADFFVIMKLDRYFNLKRQDKNPKNESLADTFVIDLPNYIDLSWALQVEEDTLSEFDQVES